ncbi:MAG: hypothetical protein KJ556_06555 [Gammaproteobacteria bacterium]|nr:hypothetical protein [Gammaproteobacteria bacterium]MBU2059008.1 hypothetical protein [Gammaproteobacteria bacterium]MBU2174771.1 hypothetical protein [Gammaproteobacteria bacterium]MBU2245782.1 hypothetical protein [Gammaproteobacteria bacterium]MBU2343264.1 hypothetical protein [Gammaproteobacteria bacterium]
MKKLSIIKTITLLFVLVLIFYGCFGGYWFSSEQDQQATQNQIEPELNISKSDSKHQLSDISHNAPLQAALPVQKDADTTNKGKMDYDSDWCIAAKDLNQQDIDYYHRELEDWNLSSGRISPPLLDGYGADRSQYLVPYMASTYDALWQQIENDNEYAMIAAFGRYDFDIESQRKIAQRLVVKGHTGTALSHLVQIELNNAEMIYKKTGQMNADIEEHIYKALAYTAFGIKRFDLDAAFTYIIMVSSADFPPELKPLYSLGKDNKINNYINELEELIDKARTIGNVIIAPPDEGPKAAKHDFETSLAYLSRAYGYELQALKGVLPDTTGAMLEASECVQKQMEFFGDLERGRSRAK